MQFVAIEVLLSQEGSFAMNQKTIADAFNAYHAYLLSVNPQSSEAVFSQTTTALVRYTLPGWGYPAPQGNKVTQKEIDLAKRTLEQIPILKLKSALDTQSTVFKSLNKQVYAYRSRLKAFVDWTANQGWLNEEERNQETELLKGVHQAETTLKRAPQAYYGHGKISSKKVTNKRRKVEPKFKPGFKYESDLLYKEVKEFKSFLADTDYPGRLQKAWKPVSVRETLKVIGYIISWAHHYKGVPEEHLSLSLLIPTEMNTLGMEYLVTPDRMEVVRGSAEATQLTHYLDTWLCEFKQFLRERNNVSRSILNRLGRLGPLIKFQYRTRTNDKTYQDILMMQKLRSNLRLLEEEAKEQDPVADESKKWLDLPDVLSKVVHPLRLRCECRSLNGKLRSPAVIATTFRDFVIYGLLTFRPPRRIGEFCGLKFASSCSLDTSRHLKHGEFIHPLSKEEERKSSTEKWHEYLYKKIVYENPQNGLRYTLEEIDAQNPVDPKSGKPLIRLGIWLLDMTPESYKTGATYKHQVLKIPNPKFSDGRYFYDYLEAWLYGYYRDKPGNWKSGGEIYESPNENWKLYSLRMLLNPEHNHVFCKKNGTYFADPGQDGSFGNIIPNWANRFTGQRMNAHLLRDIYATWFLDQPSVNGQSHEQQIYSLAHAMAHSVETLRNIYDRRRPGQKNRPIEQAMETVIKTYLEPTANLAYSELSNAPPIHPDILAVLTPEQKQQLGLPG